MYILKNFQVGKRYLSAPKNPIKTLFIWFVFSVTTLYAQGFWTPDCTFIFGREVWFYGDTLDGHVEVHFDSSEVQILDFAAWIDSVRQTLFSDTDMYFAQYVFGNPSWVTHGDSVVFAAGNGMQVSVTGPASQYDASVQYKADTSIVATKTFVGNNYDLYDYWNLQIDGVQKMQMGSAETIDFQAGDRVTITEPAQDDILFEVEDMYSVLADSEAVLKAFLDHDDLQGFVVNEHIDWTNDQGATNIHSGNYSNTQLSQEQVEDYAGGMWAGNTETRATVTYQDGDGTVDIVVDDMNDDVPEAGDFGAGGNLDANGYVDGTIANSTIWHGSSISAGYISLNDPLYNNSGSIDLHYNADFDLSGSDLNLAAGAVDEAELDCDNAPVDEYILSYESTTGNFEWKAMASQLTQEQVEDYAGGMWAGNTETRATVTYQDGDGTVDIVVDDMNDDVPEAGDFGAGGNLDANGYVDGTIANSTVWNGSSIAAGYINLNAPLYNNSGSIDLQYSSDFLLNGNAFSIANDAIDESELNCANNPTDEYVLSYESSSSNFEWKEMADGLISWDLKKDGTLLEAITDGEDVDFIGGDGIALDSPNPRKINIEVGGTIANSTIWHGSSIAAGYINLSDPIYNNSGDIDLHYNASDFDLEYGTTLHLKIGGIDTSKLDDTETPVYIRDHQWYVESRYITISKTVVAELEIKIYDDYTDGTANSTVNISSGDVSGNWSLGFGGAYLEWDVVTEYGVTAKNGQWTQAHSAAKSTGSIDMSFLQVTAREDATTGEIEFVIYDLRNDGALMDWDDAVSDSGYEFTFNVFTQVYK